jgi:hypothetical protein
MTNIEGCQIPCLPRIAEGSADVGPQPFVKRLKRMLAKPWNYSVKKWLKRFDRLILDLTNRVFRQEKVLAGEKINVSVDHLKTGDVVRVRSREEIEAMLDRWKELRLWINPAGVPASRKIPR